MLTKQLNKIASKISDPDIPDREPDKIGKFKTKIWDLDQNRYFIITPDGEKHWYKNGRSHREDGPAVIYVNGTKEWWLNGKRHREDGPAIEDVDANVGGFKEWWLNGKQVKSKDYNSPDFQERWKKLVELERVRQVMED